MKRKQDLIYLIALIVFTLLLFTSASAQFASEKYVVTIGTAGQYQPDSAGFKNAVTKAQKLSREHNTRITIIVMPGVANIGNSFVILPDSIDWFWMPTVKISGSNATAVIKDTSAVTVKWAGAPEVINTTDTTKTIVLNGATELSYLYSVTSEGDSTLNPLSITGLASGHVLQWDGSTWENQSLSSAGIATTAALNGKADTTRSYDKAMNDAQLNSKFDKTDTVNYHTEAMVNALLAAKENSITSGTTGQYLRGDKSWQTLDKAVVGLPDVENYSLNALKDSVLKDPVIDGPMGTEALYSDPIDLGLFIANVDWKTSNMFYATINGDREFNFVNTQEGQIITLDLTLTVPSWLITFTDTTIYWPEGAPPTTPDGTESVVFTFSKMNNKIKAAYVYYLPQE